MNVSMTVERSKAGFDLSSAALHIIVMAAMFIDHTMKTVVEYDGWIFVLGRLAFPQQGFAVFALIPIWLYQGRQGYHSKPFQYCCCAFYPVHMLAPVLMSQTL